MGADRELADWKQLVAYYRKLAGETDRVRLEQLGLSTEGRPFVMLEISSAGNLAKLERYRQIQEALTDPRKTMPAQAEPLFAEGKTIIAITCNIHSTEIASSQTAAEFAYEMATGTTGRVRAILENTIILLVPSLNPDGQQLVVDWYRKYKGTPYEGSPPVVLYQKYAGHDNNRDWYAMTQQETRLAVTKLLNPWHPQIVYDVHQMGTRGARLFVPPWLDPIDPNIDPILVSEMNAMGTQTAMQLASEGKKGIVVNGVYDLWSPARDYPSYHLGIRMLTESASAYLASPAEITLADLTPGLGYDPRHASWNYPDPWPGGTWRMGDIVAYQLSAFFAMASYAAQNRERFLRNTYEVARHAVTPKAELSAFVIPAEQHDEVTAARLVNALRLGGVEVQRASAAFDADGRRFSKGSFVVELAQPYGAWAKTLLEVQHYPNLREYPGGPPKRPYDVTAQTLPLLFGVDVVAVRQAARVACERVNEVTAQPGRLITERGAAGYRIATGTNHGLFAVFALLKQAIELERGRDGSIFVAERAGVEGALRSAAIDFSVDIRAIARRPEAAMRLRLPRIGLYKSWVPSLDEGWTRFVFDRNGVPYTSIFDADIRNGGLNERFDAILVPDNSAKTILEGNHEGGKVPRTPPGFTGGIGLAGFSNLLDFAKSGGTLITSNNASLLFPDRVPGFPANALKDIPEQEFYAPGSILEVSVDAASPIAMGMGARAPVFFERGPAFRAGSGARAVASFTSSAPLMSGWLLGGEKLQGSAAIVEFPIGAGRIVAFGFEPLYRAQSEATFQFLLNALLEAGATAAASGNRGAER